ncbi:MAG: NDP-sugar synthase [Deltaproteobacteria bacterium]|nr:NDP-sugar synthase [Deltaproteobacteria bacterium]
MKAGIIAAGLGERLRGAGIATPKPLLVVGGKTLLERTIESAAEAGAEEVALIINGESPEVARYVKERRWPVPVRLTEKTTPSSMESFFTLEPELRDSPFLLATVDSIGARGTLARLAEAGRSAGPSGTLAITRLVDDEKPLWVRLGDDAMKIVEIGAGAAGSGWVTSGGYFFFPEVYRHVAEARRRGLTALRHFLALLLEEGCRLHGFPAGDSIDVDRPEDIAAAERFLAARG